MSKSQVYIQLTTSSISFLSSSTIAIMVGARGSKLSSPYRRIIFGLAVSDILQSISLITGPFAPPITSSAVAPFASGNNAFCSFNGAMFTTGSVASTMYITSLCMYYVCKLRNRMSDAEFKRIEVFLHSVPILYKLFMVVSALSLNAYTPSHLGGFCYYSVQCKDEGNGCFPARDEIIMVLYFIIDSLIVPGICLFGVIVSMFLLSAHAMERIKKGGNGRRTTSSQRNPPADFSDEIQDEDSVSSQENLLRYLSKLYKREILTQAFLYIFFNLIVYIWPLIGILLALTENIDPLLGDHPFAILFVTFFPLGGLFNICIYCRPMVTALVRKFPEISYLKAFFLVIRSGGEIPKDEKTNEKQKGNDSSELPGIALRHMSEEDFISCDDSNIVMAGNWKGSGRSSLSLRKSEEENYWKDLVSSVGATDEESNHFYSPDNETLATLMYGVSNEMRNSKKKSASHGEIPTDHQTI